MLSSILAKSDCAACKFCCSFRRQSLWETPIFPKEDLKKMQELKPAAKFRPAGSVAENTGNSSSFNQKPASNSSYTFDLRTDYHTDDPSEEAPCPFLDPSRGCTLPVELKPFECKIWPLRAIKLPDSNKLAVALTPTCPSINKVPLEKIIELTANGLGKQIINYAISHPDIIKEYSEFLSQIVYTQQDE